GWRRTAPGVAGGAPPPPPAPARVRRTRAHQEGNGGANGARAAQSRVAQSLETEPTAWPAARQRQRRLSPAEGRGRKSPPFNAEANVSAACHQTRCVGGVTEGLARGRVGSILGGNDQ